MKKLASSLALVCSAVLATSAAQAAQTSHFRASANFLIGNFNNFVDSCQVLSADVIYGGQVIQTSGAPMSMPVLIVEARYVDGCNGIDMTLDGFTETIQSVSIRGDQGAATLVAEVPVSDGNGTTILMSINLTFTANGDPTTARDTFHSHDSGVVINSRFSFTSRSAVATGTISGSFPTITGPQTINAAAQGSLSASIGKDANGDITVIKK